jgi:putative membrane protein
MLNTNLPFFTEIIIATFLGIATGTFTGITPGIHTNLVCAILSGLIGYLRFNPITISCYIISLSITHTFLDTIPSIYLGVPDESMILSALPGHRLLLKGKGNIAITLTLIGSLFALIISFIFIPLMIAIFEFLETPIKLILPYLLIAILIIFNILGKKHLLSAAMLILSGILGFIVFKIPQKEILLPLLSGLFGISGLIISLCDKTNIPIQKETKYAFDKKFILPCISATIVGGLAAFLAGFSSSHSAILAQTISPKLGDEGFLVLSGGINTANMAISIVTFYTLQKARNGSIVTIMELLKTIGIKEMILFFLVMLMAGSFATILALYLSNLFSKIIVNVNYQVLASTIIILIITICIIFSGLIGIAILLASTALGIICNKLEVARNNMMGCLIIPVIIYLL